MSGKPYVVIIGDTGSGKSTIFEKITGEKDRSSASSLSQTCTAEVFESSDGSFIIADTPGSNSMTGQFDHNLHVVKAMQHAPVSCFLIVVKADQKITTVVEHITKYAQGLIAVDIPPKLIRVCVTHMDKVSWNNEAILQRLDGMLNRDTAMFSSMDKAGETLQKDLLAMCAGKFPADISIDGEKFLSMFDLKTPDSKVQNDSRKEIDRFKKMKDDFDCHVLNNHYLPEHRMQLIFEFQQCMFDEIIYSQQRLVKNNNFSSADGLAMASKEGYITHMTLQIQQVLKTVSIEADNYLEGAKNKTKYRQCPYCATIWTTLREGKRHVVFDLWFRMASLIRD